MKVLEAELGVRGIGRKEMGVDDDGGTTERT
jgi:hypothetical protein